MPVHAIKKKIKFMLKIPHKINAYAPIFNKINEILTYEIHIKPLAVQRVL